MIVAAGLPRREFGPPGDLRDRLVGRILAGEKFATTMVDRRDQPAPVVGDRFAVPNSVDEVVCVIEVTEAETCRLADVPLAHVHADGRPTDTVDAWRLAHERVWGAEGMATSDDTLIHCVRFRVVERA